MELTSFVALFFIFGFLLCYSCESLTLIIRLAFKSFNKESLGMYYITLVMLGTRIGASLYFPAGAFLVDTGIGYIFIMKIFILSTILIIVVLYIFSKKVNAIIDFISEMLRLDSSLIIDNNTRQLKLIYSVPIFFNALAVIIPLSIATLYPDYRATIIQLGFVVNSIGTVMNVFIIEKYIAESLQSSIELGSLAVKQILTARAIGLLFIVTLIIMFINLT